MGILFSITSTVALYYLINIGSFRSLTSLEFVKKTVIQSKGLSFSAFYFEGVCSVFTEDLLRSDTISTEISTGREVFHCILSIGVAPQVYPCPFQSQWKRFSPGPKVCFLSCQNLLLQRVMQGLSRRMLSIGSFHWTGTLDGSLCDQNQCSFSTTDVCIFSLRHKGSCDKCFVGSELLEPDLYFPPIMSFRKSFQTSCFQG